MTKKTHCLRGHERTPDNVLSSGNCRTCMRMHTKKWSDANRERHLEMNRDWYGRNKERRLAASKEWSANNLDKKAGYRRARRSRLAEAPGTATMEQTEARMAYFGYRCAYCGGPFEEIDHAIPISRGGSNWPANLRPACQRCNRTKFTKTYKEFSDHHRIAHD